jgi:hypothetical protein
MKKTPIFGSNSPSKTELSVSPNFEINGFSSSKKGFNVIQYVQLKQRKYYKIRVRIKKI